MTTTTQVDYIDLWKGSQLTVWPHYFALITAQSQLQIAQRTSIFINRINAAPVK